MGTFELDERVFLCSLTSASGMELNLKPGRVISAASEGRVGIELLRTHRRLSVKPSNLLHADLTADRERLLLYARLAHSPGLRLARRALDEALNENEGLLCHIAEWFPDQSAIHQFSGFMGQVSVCGSVGKKGEASEGASEGAS